ncbi:MAG: VPLPA-CTERM sorting domain-containing protein [Gammaproteobacteria bacterium]|nr:VPLPA-CTERM sorting domain-containing protein [Gammaproteobacteria bacterium]
MNNKLSLCFALVMLMNVNYVFASSKHEHDEDKHSSTFETGQCSVVNALAAITCDNFEGNDLDYSKDEGEKGFEHYINATFSDNLDEKFVWTNSSNLLKFSESDDIHYNHDDGGLWELKPGLSIDSPFVLTIKSGDFFAAYLFASSQSSGTFYIDGVSRLKDKHHDNDGDDYADLSHISLYSQTAVPIPATLWLLLPAVFGFIGLRRRIRNKT